MIFKKLIVFFENLFEIRRLLRKKSEFLKSIILEQKRFLSEFFSL